MKYVEDPDLVNCDIFANCLIRDISHMRSYNIKGLDCTNNLELQRVMYLLLLYFYNKTNTMLFAPKTFEIHYGYGPVIPYLLYKYNDCPFRLDYNDDNTEFRGIKNFDYNQLEKTYKSFIEELYNIKPFYISKLVIEDFNMDEHYNKYVINPTAGVNVNMDIFSNNADQFKELLENKDRYREYFYNVYSQKD